MEKQEATTAERDAETPLQDPLLSPRMAEKASTKGYNNICGRFIYPAGWTLETASWNPAPWLNREERAVELVFVTPDGRKASYSIQFSGEHEHEMMKGFMAGVSNAITTEDSPVYYVHTPVFTK